MAEIEDLTNALREEIDATARFVAENMEGGTPFSDVVKVPHAQALDYVRRGWMDPQFRQDLLQRLGPTQFLRIASEAHGLPMPKVNAALLGQDPKVNLERAGQAAAEPMEEPTEPTNEAPDLEPKAGGNVLDWVKAHLGGGNAAE